MRKFINKISKGSKLALFLEILLVVQIVIYIYAYVTRPTCHSNNYPGQIVVGGDVYDD